MENSRSHHADQELRQSAEPDYPPDWLLERWVRLAEIGIEVGITLQTGGFLVSGTLVGERAYLTHVRAEVVGGLVQRGLPPVVARKLDQAFESDIAELDQRASASDDNPDSSPRFIHLRDARFMGEAGQGARFQIPFWRGQLRRVDGFFVGTLRQPLD